VLALAVYLVAVAAFLFGPSVLAGAVALVVVAAVATAYVRYPDGFHRRARAIQSRSRALIAAWRARRAQRQARPAKPVSKAVTRPVRMSRIDASVDARGLTSGSPVLRVLLGRGWRNPASMARDFVLIALGGGALLLAGQALPDWPVISWIGKFLSLLGLLCVLIASGVLYSAWQDRR